MQARLAVITGNFGSRTADDDQQHVAGAYFVAQHAPKIGANRDIVYVLKDAVVTESVDQVVGDPPGHADAVGAAVGDKDTRHDAPLDLHRAWLG
jgi:hypothetical protein